jgi:hypothetical protein
MLNTPA